MSEPAVEPLGTGGIRKAPSHNLIFKKSEEKRLDELF